MVARAARDSRFRLEAAQARALAAEFGTPLYVLDEAHLRARTRAYLAAAKAAWPRCEVVFAVKANPTLALLSIVHQEGCMLDVASEGELRFALAAGVPASACHLHGNNKSRDELAFAIGVGVGHIVADHFDELELIAQLGGGAVPVVLRLAPGVDPITHAKISTGQADTKFGFNIADGSAERAALRARALGLDLIGFHCHVGSQLLDPEAQRAGGELVARFAAEMSRRHGIQARLVNVGGGLGARYTDADAPMDVADYCRLVSDAVRTGLDGSLPDVALYQEPGRALVAESGVTLYTVGVVKTVPTVTGSKTYVAVDGGVAENPRPALYGGRYTVERVAAAHDWSYVTDGPGAVAVADPGESTFTVSGRHCEVDQLYPDVRLPSDLAPGDLLQVLTTGAYHASMASNYNRYPRPASVLIRPDGGVSLIQRRDTWDEMLARETVPSDLAVRHRMAGEA